MVSQGRAIRPPAVTLVEIDDPAMAGEGIDVLDLEALQLQSMPLRVRRVVVRLDACTVVYHSTNTRLRTRTSVREDRIAYLTFF
jgi:hypothetical protein